MQDMSDKEYDDSNTNCSKPPTTPESKSEVAKISKEDFNKGVAAHLNIVGPDYQPYQPEEFEEGIFPEKDIYKALDENEIGDATLIIKLFKGRRLYDQRADPAAAWLYWNDHYWREDTQKQIFILVNEVVNLYFEQRKKEEARLECLPHKRISQEEKDKIANDLKNKINKLREREQALLTLRRRNSVLKLSSMGTNSLGYVGDGWDQNPWLLGCKNGVVDLRNGIFREGRPDDYIKTICPVKWDNKAECHKWRNSLFEIFDGNKEKIDFIQRLLGYSITGLREEHIYPICWGPHGRNGKGTIFETLKLVLGDMAYKVSTQTIMQGLQNTGPNSGLMRFLGTRLAWTSEANKHDTLDTAIIKTLCGGDTITGRNPFERREMEFVPSHTLFTLTNNLPRVDADDDAFWSRVILITFNLSFKDEPDPKRPWERLKNKKLGEELSRELPGILRWLVQGTLMWQQQGLCIPENLKMAKSKYRDNEDVIKYFLNERCVVDFSDEAKTKTHMRIKPKLLYHEYQEWCKGSGFKAFNQKNFHEAVRKKIGEPIISRGYSLYAGIAFKDSCDEI